MAAKAKAKEGMAPRAETRHRAAGHPCEVPWCSRPAPYSCEYEPLSDRLGHVHDDDNDDDHDKDNGGHATKWYCRVHKCGQCVRNDDDEDDDEGRGDEATEAAKTPHGKRMPG